MKYKPTLRHKSEKWRRFEASIRRSNAKLLESHRMPLYPWTPITIGMMGGPYPLVGSKATIMWMRIRAKRRFKR